MADLKETLKKYISENNIRLKEQDDVKDEVEAARNALFNVSDERLLQSIRSLESVDQIGSFMIDLIDFANKMSPAPDITRQLAHQYIDKGMIDVDAEEEDESASREVEFDIKPELEDEEDLSEISTPGDTKGIEDKIKSGKLDLKKLQDATEKAMKGDTTALTSIMTGIDIVGIDEEMEEISTSAGAGAYLTKAAFKPKYGYKLVKKKSKKDS